MIDADLERGDTEYPLVVVSSSQTELHLSADPESEDSPYVHITFPDIGRMLDLPSAGDPVIVLGGGCDFTKASGYVRVMNLEHEILWEGGDPYCSLPRDRFLRLEPIADSEVCWWEPRGFTPEPGCCCLTRRDQFVVLQTSPVTGLPAGSTFDFQVDFDPTSRFYVAASQGGYETGDSPCSADYTGIYGSAFIARLAE